MKSNSIFFLPKDAYIPPAAHQNSPLKRKRKDLVVDAVASQTLQGSTHATFGKKQKIEMLCLEQALLEELPISIQLQCETLQKSLQKRNSSLQENNLIISTINQILKKPDWNEQEKLTELGILHYYVASRKLLPTFVTATLLKHRINEIENEVCELKEKHELDCENVSELGLPSGVTAYLMRAFSRMIFPPDGAFNLGGCYAIVSLLKSHINAFLSDEMRAQILNISQLFINDEEFRKLFQEPFEVHPQMEELICLDLKLPLKEKMSFIYVRWCLVTALFTPIGQLDHEPNCYAVAILLNLLIDSPRNVVQLMIEALRKGSFSFEQTEIPVLPLLESQRYFEPDFKVLFTPDRARGSVPYLTTNAALGIPAAPKVYLDEQSPLSTWIENDFNDQVKSAKEFFISHRLSFLQQMVLAILKFAAQNNTQAIRPESHKVEIFNKIVNQIKLDMSQWINISAAEQDPLWKPFFSDFVSFLMNSFFCVDYTHWDFQVKDNKVVFAFHSQGFAFNGNLKNYKEFAKLRRFFHFSFLSGFKPVDRLSAFAEYCVEHLDKNRSPFDSFALKQWRRLLRSHLQSPQFCTALAQILAASNSKEASLGWEEYLKADSLFLIQDGGYITHVCNLSIFKEKFQRREIISGIDPLSHFINLCEFIKKYREELGSQVLADDPEHSFNIIPKFFQSYMDDPAESLRQKVIIPGVGLLNKDLSYKQMERALKMTLGAEEGEILAKEKFKIPEMSCIDFSSRAETILKPDEYTKFKSVLNQVVQSFKFTHFIEKLPKILEELDLPMDDQIFEELILDMEENAIQTFFTPAEAAAFLQKTLIDLESSIYIPKMRLEEAICICFDFPQVIWVGNLNWVELKAEQPDFSYLILKYDIGEMEVVYERRKGENDKALPNNSTPLYKSMLLFF